MVQGSDLLANEQLHIDADMVVLAAAIEPDKSARADLATMLTASMDTNDFFTEAHPKLRPVESPTAGVFLSGVCQGPKDIPETVAQAGAAAVEGHRPAGQGQAAQQPLRGPFRRADVQRLLPVREGLPLRRHHLCGQGSPRPPASREVRRVAAGQRGRLPGLRRLHRDLSRPARWT